MSCPLMGKNAPTGQSASNTDKKISIFLCVFLLTFHRKTAFA